jgi:hypothetical protein
MGELSFSMEADELLKKFGAELISMDKDQLAEANHLYEKVSHEESKKDQVIRQRSWIATRDKPVGC